jgi:hypothetical protein
MEAPILSTCLTAKIDPLRNRERETTPAIVTPELILGENSAGYEIVCSSDLNGVLKTAQQHE